MEIRSERRKELWSRGKTKKVWIRFVVISIIFLCVLATTGKVSAIALKNPVMNSSGTSSVWDCVYFGRYPQASDGKDGFLVEPIKWRVLKVSENEVWLIADKKLDVIPYHKTLTAVYFEDSYLKNWLNTVFLDTAFTEEEQAEILDFYYGKVHIPSKQEISYAVYGFINNSSRSAINTDYVIDRFEEYANPSELPFVLNAPDTFGAYWLREPVGADGVPCVVRGTGYGDVQSYGSITSEIVGVRPMIRLNTAAKGWSYAGKLNNFGNKVKEVQTITGSNSFEKTYGAAPFSLGAKAKGKLTYQSDKPGIAAVSSGGIVTIKSAGTAHITIKAAATDDYEAAEKTVQIKVEKAKQAISARNLKKTYGAKPFALRASAKTKLTYKSSRPKVAKVSAKGRVSIKNPGKTAITITAAETSQYKKANRKIWLNVKLKRPTLKVRSIGKRRFRLTWNKVPGADRYQVYMYDRKKKKYVRKITKKAKHRFAIHGNVKKGKLYKYKVRAYRKVSGKKVYSAYSVVKKKRVK